MDEHSKNVNNWKNSWKDNWKGDYHKDATGFQFKRENDAGDNPSLKELANDLSSKNETKRNRALAIVGSGLITFVVVAIWIMTEFELWSLIFK
jgi:hypothetical protein